MKILSYLYKKLKISRAKPSSSQDIFAIKNEPEVLTRTKIMPRKQFLSSLEDQLFKRYEPNKPHPYKFSIFFLPNFIKRSFCMRKFSYLSTSVITVLLVVFFINTLFVSNPSTFLEKAYAAYQDSANKTGIHYVKIREKSEIGDMATTYIMDASSNVVLKSGAITVSEMWDDEQSGTFLAVNRDDASNILSAFMIKNSDDGMPIFYQSGGVVVDITGDEEACSNGNTPSDVVNKPIDESSNRFEKLLNEKNTAAVKNLLEQVVHDNNVQYLGEIKNGTSMNKVFSFPLEGNTVTGYFPQIVKFYFDPASYRLLKTEYYSSPDNILIGSTEYLEDTYIDEKNDEVFNPERYGLKEEKENNDLGINTDGCIVQSSPSA